MSRKSEHRNTPLYKQWCYMKRRSKDRTKKGETCKVYPDWDVIGEKGFLSFKKWSLENGYKEGLFLCRNNDSGDYSPQNCRWATCLENVEECHSKTYFVKRIEDTEWSKIFNLNKFCRENSLSAGNLCEVAKGRRKQHKGWLCLLAEGISDKQGSKYDK